MTLLFFHSLSCRALYLRISIVAFIFLRPPIYFPVPSSMSLPRSSSAGATSVLYSFPKGYSRSFSSPNTPHILFQFFQPFCTLWVSSASSFSSSDNVYRRYVIVFTFFTVSYCKWIWGIAQEKCSCPQPILEHTTCPAGSPWCGKPSTTC